MKIQKYLEQSFNDLLEDSHDGQEETPSRLEIYEEIPYKIFHSTE